MDDLLDKFWSEDPWALARVITIMENDDIGGDEMVSRLFTKTGNAYILGVTGAPGTGKSSLVDKLTTILRKRDQKVGIIAVDPTSPFTGGALLGDRIRMQGHAVDPGVFIRSMGTRGSLGGLSHTTKKALIAMDAFGCDWIIVETVGVGQAELNIMGVADSVLLVLSPGAGDSIQTMKAGIMEIADLFVVNKSDLPGADQVAAEIETMLNLQLKKKKWRPPVIQTSTVKGEGLEDLFEAVEKNRAYLYESRLFHRRRKLGLRSETLEILARQLQLAIRKKIKTSAKANSILELVETGKEDPYTAASSILKDMGFDELLNSDIG